MPREVPLGGRLLLVEVPVSEDLMRLLIARIICTLQAGEAIDACIVRMGKGQHLLLREANEGDTAILSLADRSGTLTGRYVPDQEGQPIDLNSAHGVVIDVGKPNSEISFTKKGIQWFMMANLGFPAGQGYKPANAVVALASFVE